jgi:hypothetical protein
MPSSEGAISFFAVCGHGTAWTLDLSSGSVLAPAESDGSLAAAVLLAMSSGSWAGELPAWSRCE